MENMRKNLDEPFFGFKRFMRLLNRKGLG
jgi:hypothetical protein